MAEQDVAEKRKPVVEKQDDIRISPHDVARIVQAVNTNAKAGSLLPTPGMDKAKVPGGQYKVNGRWVDAHGQPIEPPEGESA